MGWNRNDNTGIGVIRVNGVVMLPGLDGTGLLFEWLLRELPGRVVRYPDAELGMEELGEVVLERAPDLGECLVVAESFPAVSGRRSTW